MREENDLFLERGSIALVFVYMVEIDLVLYAGRKSLDYSVSIELGFAFVWVFETDLISL